MRGHLITPLLSNHENLTQDGRLLELSEKGRNVDLSCLYGHGVVMFDLCKEMLKTKVMLRLEQSNIIDSDDSDSDEIEEPWRKMLAGCIDKDES